MSRWPTMQARVEAYLDSRRRLGYELRIEGEQLQRFAHFADALSHHGVITIALALAWACASDRSGPIGRARRLQGVRALAKFCVPFEPETQVPPARLLGPSHRRLTPHIYTEGQLTQLLNAAGELAPAQGLRPATMGCLLGLLAATGLRVGEALHLQRTDVDLEQGLLCVRQTKFRKSRFVPLHHTTRDALAAYAEQRDQHLPLPRAPAFFLCDNGHAFNAEQARYAFQCLRARLGWDSVPGRRPRLYDLRHTFACRRLLAWYQAGIDVNAAMPLLATYLGHTKVTDTYWYLTAIPALMAIVSERFDSQLEQVEP